MKKLFMGVLIGLSMMLTGCSNPEKLEGLKSNEIGWYIELPSNEEFTNYELVTPRGKEKVAGLSNLNKSINEYIKADVFGKDPKDLNESQRKRFRVK